MPPKRTLDPSSIEDPELLEDWCNKRKRPLNDEHITMRKYPRRGPQNHVSPSSLRANSSLSKSVSSTSTRVLPGGFPSDSSGSDWSPWMSETRIFWTRAFMSVRSSLADALSRLLRSREEERRSVSVSAVSLAFTTSAASSSRASIQLPGGLDALSEAETVLEEVEPPERPEQDGDDGPTPLSRLPTLLDIPQTTIALGGHTIQLNSPQPPRLLSGIRLAQPDENAWPPPRRPLRPSPRMPEAERSGATEADLDAQRRPECGYRDNTPSVHANSIYEM